MSFWTAMVVIAAIMAFTATRIARYRTGSADAGPAPESALHKEIEELRQRVKVLERIATDANTVEGRHSRAIANEIEELRDR
jgi:hypothetical protein